MLIVLYVIISLAVYYFAVKGIYNFLRYIQEKKLPEAVIRRCNDPEDWNPHFSLKHKGVRLFHLPFEPNKNEVIYFGRKENEKREKFIEENYDLIERKFADKGFKFVYLPYLRTNKEDVVKFLYYKFPQGLDESVVDDIADKVAKAHLSNDFLYRFMVMPMNRNLVEGGFAWLNFQGTTPTGVQTSVYDYIAFDADEAMLQPEEVLDEICEALGHGNSWQVGLYCTHEREDGDPAEWYFDTDTRNLLEEVKEKVNKLRLMGVSEAVINEFLDPKPVLSRIVITHDFRIFLPDFKNKEICMEPLNKAVFILFLRHPEGIVFKDLPDYRRELGFIYQAIRKKNNDVDERMAKKNDMPTLNVSIAMLTDPFNNSINEKCTRIKEAFLEQMHESVAEKYYVTGHRAEIKKIELPTDLIVWE